jgi:hypothetical protein
VGELLALYFANAPGDHSAASGVEPVSYVSGRRLGRGRAGR